MNFDWASLLAAFGGGILGAAVGAVPAFVFTGILVLIGVASAAAGGDARIISDIAFGPFFGPHVSFAGGVAAAAYAGHIGLMPNGRDVGRALMGLNNPMLLLVGGIFGVAGSFVNAALQKTGAGAWTDTVAVTVLISGFAARIIFGKTSVIGKPRPGAQHFYPDDVNHWLPWQQKASQLLVIGLAVGLVSGRLFSVLGPQKGGDAVGFGLSTAFLILLVMGNQIPVTHHVAITAAVAATLGAGLVTCAIVGVLAAFIGEGFSRAFLIHGDTHVDPPAGAIAILTTIIRLASAGGVFHNHLP